MTASRVEPTIDELEAMSSEERRLEAVMVSEKGLSAAKAMLEAYNAKKDVEAAIQADIREAEGIRLATLHQTLDREDRIAEIREAQTKARYKRNKSWGAWE